MSAALTATDIVLAREQKLHALDGLAAAAAHELGTPLSTIVLVTKELEHTVKADSPLYDDIELLEDAGAALPRDPAEADAPPGRGGSDARARSACAPCSRRRPSPTSPRRSPSILRPRRPPRRPSPAGAKPRSSARPGVIYGLGNIIENATEFAKAQVDVNAEWNATGLVISIADDGPGFPVEVMDNIGEPYVTTRPAEIDSGPGRGFDRTGAWILHRQDAAGALRRHGQPRQPHRRALRAPSSR